MRTHPRFDVRLPLGEGGYGTVFEAHDHERGERVALKLLHRTTPHALAAFKREFRTLSGLVHAGLPRLHELFVHDDEWFFSMELVEGEDLRLHVNGARAPVVDLDSLTRTGDAMRAMPDLGSAPPVPVASVPTSEMTGRVRATIDALADVLAFVHRSGVVHCDVKPSNVRVGMDGRIVLLDFGLARPLREAAGRFAGTLAYAAPEQLAGDFGAAADLYALGSLAYELLAGRPPFGVGAEAAENKQRRDPPRLLLRPEDADLAALVSGLLSRAPAERGAALARYRRVAVVVGGVADHERVVGRHDALAMVERALETVKAGAAAVLELEGASGIGKTTVLREAERRLRAREPGVVVLRGRAAEGEHVPWNLFDGIADGLAELHTAGTPVLAPVLAPVLGRAFPVLRGHVVPDVEGTPDDDVASGFRRALASLGPTVLFLDDVQWADADSRRLLAAILAPPRIPPILVVLAKRPGPAPGQLRLTQEVQQITLGPLSIADTHELVLARRGEEDVDLDAIARESRGHPLFVEELLRADRDDLARSLDGVLGARVRRLAVRARRIVEVLALATEPLTSRAVAEIVEDDLGEVTRSLDALREGHLVRSADGPHAVRNAPFHDRLADVVRGALAPDDARALHASFVRWLEARDSAAEAMCHHLQGAGRTEDAGRYALLAADRAQRAMAFEREAWFCLQSLTLAPPAPAAQRALRLRRAEALRKARLSVAAADELMKIAEGDDPGNTRALRTSAARLYLAAGELTRGQAILGSLLAHYGDTPPRTYARAALAMVRERSMLRLELALPWALRRASPPEPDRLAALRAIAEGLGMIDTLRAAVFHTRALRVGLRSPDPVLRGELLAIEAIFVGNTNRAGRRAAHRLVDRALAPFDGEVPERVTGFVAAVHAMWGRCQRPSHANLQRFKEVEAFFEKHGEGDAWVVWSLRLSRSRGARILGDLNEMRGFFYPALAEAEQQQDAYALVTLRRSHSLLHLAADDPAAARQMLADTHWPRTEDSYHIQDWLDVEARLEADLYERRAIELTPTEWRRLWRSSLHYGDTQRVVHLYMRGRLLLTFPRSPASDLHVRIEVLRTVHRLVAQRQGWALATARVLRAGLAGRQRRWNDAIDELRALQRLTARYELLSLDANASLLVSLLVTGRESQEAASRAARFYREHGVRRPEAWACIDFPSFADLLDGDQSSRTKSPSSA